LCEYERNHGDAFSCIQALRFAGTSADHLGLYEAAVQYYEAAYEAAHEKSIVEEEIKCLIRRAGIGVRSGQLAEASHFADLARRALAETSPNLINHVGLRCVEAKLAWLNQDNAKFAALTGDLHRYVGKQSPRQDATIRELLI